MRYTLLFGIAALTLSCSTAAQVRQKEAKELVGKFKWIDFRYYPSSVTPGIRLAATFRKPRKPAPILVTAHGWHGSLAVPTGKDDRPGRYFTINVDMRGRAHSTGKPDASGWELQDWIDAVEFARREYAEYISDPECVYAVGGSGSGGNVYSLLWKFPDFFAAAVVRAGMSDYAEWYRRDEKGEFRDELEPWIGGTLDEKPEAYKSRSGLTTVGNILTPLVIFHAEEDIRVPVYHARAYYEAAKKLGKNVRYFELAGAGGRGHFDNITPEQTKLCATRQAELFEAYKRPPVLPGKGHMVVAGYLKTKMFRVVLSSIDRIGEVDYDLEPSEGGRRFEIKSETAESATLAVHMPGAEPRDVRVSASRDGRPLVVSLERRGEWLQAAFELRGRVRLSFREK